MYIPKNYYTTIGALGFYVFDNSTQNKRVHFIMFCLGAPKHHTEPLEVWACPWPTLSSKQPFPSLSRWRSNPPLDRFCHQTPWIWLRRPWPVWIQAMGRRHWSWNWGLAMSLGCKQKCGGGSFGRFFQFSTVFVEVKVGHGWRESVCDCRALGGENVGNIIGGVKRSLLEPLPWRLQFSHHVPLNPFRTTDATIHYNIATHHPFSCYHCITANISKNRKSRGLQWHASSRNGTSWRLPTRLLIDRPGWVRDQFMQTRKSGVVHERLTGRRYIFSGSNPSTQRLMLWCIRLVFGRIEADMQQKPKNGRFTGQLFLNQPSEEPQFHFEKKAKLLSIGMFWPRKYFRKQHAGGVFPMHLSRIFSPNMQRHFVHTKTYDW